MDTIDATAQTLANLYTQDFGGKRNGRYRCPRRYLADLLGRRRIYPDDITAVSRALLEKGYVLIDMETFFVVMSANAFVNYRRVAKDAGKKAG